MFVGRLCNALYRAGVQGVYIYPAGTDGEARENWAEIFGALRDINYDGYVVMEPFVQMGGQVGKDISIWRDMSHGASIEELDADAAASVAYLRKTFCK